MPLIVIKILLMFGLKNYLFLLAKSLRLSRNNNTSPCNDLTERLFTSIIQTLSFFSITHNQLMLPWCMELTLLQYTSHLCLWHMARQKSHHIPKKCLKSCMLHQCPSYKRVHIFAEFNSILINRCSFRPYA